MPKFSGPLVQPDGTVKPRFGGAPIGQPQPPETGIADIFTGSERKEATPELGTLPEFGTTAAF